MNGNSIDEWAGSPLETARAKYSAADWVHGARLNPMYRSMQASFNAIERCIIEDARNRSTPAK